MKRNARVRALIAIALVALTVPAVASAKPTAGRTVPESKPTPLIWGDLAPAFPGDIVVRQPDGSSFKAGLTNAEVGGNLEVDGYTVTKRADGWWVYADGRNGAALTETAARVGHDARPQGLRLGAGRTRNVWLDDAGADIRSQALRQLQLASWQASRQAAEAGTERVFRFPVLMLATWWDTEKGQTSPQFQEGATPEMFTEMLDGFGGNPTGTVTEFYFENSFGQFRVQVDVFGPFTSQRSRQDRCYYGGIEPSGDPLDDLDPIDDQLGIGGGGAIGMALEAVPQADPAVDFSQYDNDGDGIVDFTAILHSGPDMAATGDKCHTWSHAIQATLGLVPAGGIPTTDGVFVDRLFTMPEVDLEIGVAAHEMAHALGEPDYYNPSYTSMGTGDWDMMAGGSWFGNPPGSNPTGFSPASKVFQGWITPRVIEDDVRDVKLALRSLQPKPGYQATDVDPNIVLVPTKTIAVGETDEQGHQWTGDDVYGLATASDGRYVIEGYYLENFSRSVNAPPFDPRMKRQPYFDRALLGSGLMVWHFDYHRRSNTYAGGNDAGSDPNRPQMDPVEFDFNDNTQELQLGLTRGEPQDLVTGAATGITSGTRRIEPGVPDISGTPQADQVLSGVVPPGLHKDHAFTVEDNPANYKLRVAVTGTGDCTLQLLRDGVPVGGVQDAGFVGGEEFVEVIEPEPGQWTARIGDFAACTVYDGTIEFSHPSEVFSTKGAGDTWSNWTESPTGWAFTNVRPSDADGRDTALDAGNGVLTLDVLRIADGAKDVSPGFVTPTELDAKRANRVTVPIFNNGDTAVNGVAITVRTTSATGPVVARGTVNLPAYSRADFAFDVTPDREGPLPLFVVVDDRRRVAEESEANNTQRTLLQASPAGGRVLVVDDDGAHDSEDTVTGALSVLGIPFDVVTEHVDAATMSRYTAVVWEAGLERYQGQMDPDDRAAVAAYLDGGGRLLYASPRAAAALGEPPSSTNPLATDDMAPFLADYFGAEYADTLQVGGGAVTGTGDILGSGTFKTDVFTGRPLQDVFTAAASGNGTVTPVATWEKGGEGSLMGLRVEGDAAHKGFRTVFLGLNPSQLVAGKDAVTVLSRSLAWLGVRPGGYPASAGPVLRHTAVRSGLPGTAIPVKAFVVGSTKAPTLSYRSHAGGAFVSVVMSKTGTGVWQATIPGSVVRSDGVEYYISLGTVKDPVSAKLPHFVSVALSL